MSECIKILISWILLSLGLVLFEEYGMIVSLMLVAFASSFRDMDEDKESLSVLYDNRSMHWIILPYYIFVLLFILYDLRRFSDMSLLVTFSVIMFPVFITYAISDIKKCILNNKKK